MGRGHLLRQIYRRHWPSLAATVALALLTAAAGAGLLGVAGWFLTGAALAGAGGAFNLFAPSALVRGLSFLRIVSRYADRVVGHAATLRLLADLRAAVFTALIRLTPRQLARYRSGDRLNYYKLNQAIHIAIVRLAKNATLSEVQLMLQTRLKRIRFIGHEGQEKWAAAVAEHEEMIAALEARNGAKLSEVLGRHLAKAWERVRDAI